MLEIDIDSLIFEKIIKSGGNENDFAKIDALIIEYASRSGMPEDGIAMIILDCLDSGFCKENVEKQLRVYDSKRCNGLIA